LVPKEKIEKGEIKDEDVYARICQYLDEDTSEEVELEQLLSLDPNERKVILFEGSPGSGKSTLLWHICQRWQSGEQFQQFTLVLLVLLKDSAYHAAQSLAGLIPLRSHNLSQCVASEIEAIQGEGVLLILDGWDEAPAKLRQEGSFFHDLVAKPSLYSVEKATIVVSSRPLASHDLCVYLSSRVELRGFREEMRERYIREALVNDPDAAQSLIEKIESFEDSGAMDLSLPLNIASLTHIFSICGGDLPSTPCRIAIMLVLSILFRQIRKAHPDGKSLKALNSFEDLPHPARDCFQHICRIAYNGIVNEQFSFTEEELAMPLSVDVVKVSPGQQATYMQNMGNLN
jgi:hypothetical protein